MANQLINVDVSDAINGLRRINLEFGKPFLNELGAFQIAKINLRTKASKDWAGLPFKPYSESYKKFRRKKGKPVNKPDLIFKDQMLASMNVRVLKGPKVRVGFPGTQVDKAIWNNATREFFRYSDKDVDKIREMVNAEVLRIIRASEG
jgi:hypothetical protein